MFSTSVIKIVTLHNLKHNEIHLSRHLAMQWKVQKDDSITLIFGITSVLVNITSIDDSENVLFVAPSLLSQLKLSNGQQLHYSYRISLHELTLGPIIAVLTEINEEDIMKFGSITSFCNELAIVSEQSNCYFYVTSLSLWSKTCIIGYRFLNGEWCKEEMPFPSIVYNRIHTRRTEQSETFQDWYSIIKDYHIPHFNDRFLNKWEVYEALISFPHIKPFLPASYLFTNRTVLEQALHKFHCVFVKPVYGSQGRNICKVTSSLDKILLDYTTFQDEICKEYVSFPKLFQTLKQLIGRRPYIVQQGLSLFTYGERSVDFRMLCHKNHIQTWNVTSTVARVSNSQQFVSNVAMGGELFKIEKVLATSFEANEVKHMKKLLIELAVETAKCLEQSQEGLFAEFGMDVAVDKDGNPWIIEVNVKPSKNMMPSTLSVRPSARAIIQYCCAAAKQPLRRNV